MRQIGIQTAGLNPYSPLYLTHLTTLHFYYASTMAVYVYETKTFSLVNVITVDQTAITSFSVSPADENVLIIGCVTGEVVYYDMTTKRVSNAVQIPASKTAIMLCDQFDPNICVMVDRREGNLNRIISWVFRDEEASTSAILNHKILEFKKNVVVNVARWHPAVCCYMALGCSSGELYLFNYTESTKKIFTVKDRPITPIVDVQWDRLSSVYILVAYTNYISLWDTEAQSEINVFEKAPTGVGVTSISWLDWTAGNFVSSNSINGTLKVWNVSQKTSIDSIRVGDVGISYIKLGPGTKQCACAHVDGSITVYHLEKKHAEFKTNKGHRDTIFDLRISPLSAEIFATASYDTTVKLWNSSDLSLSKTLYGADSVIYSITWSPSGNSIAACTSNGVIIIWSVQTGRELTRYCHHSKPSFCVTWNTLHRDILCSTSSDCSIVIFQVNETHLLEEVDSKVARGSQKLQQRVISEANIKMKVTLPSPVFGAHFSPFCGNLLVVGAQDGNVRIFDYLLSNPMLCVLKGHASRVFNCLWSPLDDSLIASGSDDHNVLVWKVDMDTLNECREKSTGDETSKQKPISSSPFATLSGHESNVRAIHWNTEFKNVLLSGSWDCTIRIWNIDTQECIRYVKGHAADVYALAAHPDRPFSYFSCSRDSTIRMWEMEGVVRLSLVQSVWSSSCESGRSNSQQDDSSTKGFVLAGKTSLIISHKLGSPSNAFSSSEIPCGTDLSIDERIEFAKKYYILFNFYCGNNGCLDVWECALSLLLGEMTGSTPGPLPSSLLLRPGSCRLIQPRGEFLMNAESDARKCDTVKINARGENMSEKNKNQLLQAAQLYARVGNYAKYCSIMVELGRHHEALAMAPCVSLDYWRELSLSFANDLATKSSELCVPYFIGVGKEDAAINYYLNRDDMQSAVLVASKAEAGTTLPTMRARTPPRTQVVQVGSAGGYSRSAFASEITATASAAMGLNKPKGYVKAVSHAYADRLVLGGKPILAAAQHLSTGNFKDAVKLLTSCGEYELSLALALCFKIKNTDEIKTLLAQRVSDQGGMLLAIEILDSTSGDEMTKETEKCFLVSRHYSRPDEEQAKAFLKNNSLRSRSAWDNLANEKEMMGSDGESIVPLIISNQYTKAVTLSLAFLRNFVRDPLELPAGGKTVLRGLKFVRASFVETRLRASFLMHMLWFGSHEAAELGLWSLAACMLAKLGVCCKKMPFPISEDQVALQEVFFRIFSGDANAVTKLSTLVESCSSEVASSIKTLQDLLDGIVDKFSLGVKPQERGEDDGKESVGFNIYGSSTNGIREAILCLGDAMSLPSLLKLSLARPGTGAVAVVLGSQLPSVHNISSVVSCISGEVIVGVAVAVDSAATGYASVSEVLAWARVNPFEPGMSGEWILPIYNRCSM